MITYKQIEKDERLALKTISTFLHDHSIFLCAIVLPFILIFLFGSWTIIMMLAAVGGGAFENSVKEQFISGEISVYQYNVDMKILDILVWNYNFEIILMRFIFAGIILAAFYFTFKEYLKYKRDNL